MQRSFGVTIGRAAIIKKGQDVYLIAVNTEKAKRIAIGALEKIKAKLPCHARIVVEKR
jgi:ribosomal protein L16/L10AE